MRYGSGDMTRQKFTQKERDTESGLDYFLARYYSSAQGRFTSTDPTYFQMSMAIDPQRFNLYGYGRNNPLKWVDPNGERLFLGGDTNWLQTNVLYEMAGGQAAFDRYFEIQSGQVVLRAGVSTADVSSGVQQILDLVNATDNYLYFAGTDGGGAVDLFSADGGGEALRDNRGRLTQAGRNLSEEFTGSSSRTGGVGFVIGTAGRGGTPAPADLASGDPVFAVIAYNTRREATQSSISLRYMANVPDRERNLVLSAQLAGREQVVRPVSQFIHESAENLAFARAGNRNYGPAHGQAMAREAIIRRDLGITGGFSGGGLTSRIR
jgi:RHS repeat-associated protein